MKYRRIIGSVCAFTGISILAGNAVTYWSRAAYELIPVGIGLLLCIIAAALLLKKNHRVI